MGLHEAANGTRSAMSGDATCTTIVSRNLVDSGPGRFVSGRKLNEFAATFKYRIKKICPGAKSLPQRVIKTQILGTLALVGMIVSIILRTPLPVAAGGEIAILSVIVYCCYAGPGISVLIPLQIAAISGGVSTESKALLPTSEVLTGVFVITAITGLTGLTGQYRRRLQNSTRCQKQRLFQQQRALSLARILFRDLEGRITTWTEGAEGLFGWTSAEATGQLVHELLHTEFPLPLARIRSELLERCQWQGELKQRHKDGSELIIAAHWILYHAAESAECGVAEVHNDVTLLRQTEAKVRDSERKKDLFVATLAHELRNPLAPLRSGLDCLRLIPRTSPEDGPILEIMGRQLEHMVRLVDDLLDVSRINTGKVVLRLEQIVLSQILTDAINACRTHIDAAAQLLTVDLPDDPVYLHADAGRLTQVLTNLLHNASKFTQAKGCIHIAVECLARQVDIRIRDSGTGIPTEMAPHVFDMFAQVQDVRTRGQCGLGLGLNIVKSLVEMHGGTVAVHSDGPGKGAEFAVRLPRVIDHAPREELDVPHTLNAVSESRRVLIVDDNRDAARTLALALNIRGCTCRSAFDGASGLKEAEGFDPHIFVLDLGMPGMSGFDLARRLRAQARFEGAVLIAVTGWDKDDDMRASKAAGFDYHLAKPVDVMTLYKLVNGNIGRPR